MDQLKEIPLPPPVSWMPQTPAWYVAAGLLILLLAWLGVRAVHSYRRNRYRRAALTELEQIRKATLNNPEALATLPELVKRVAFQVAPREKVAALSGDSWLLFLDRSYRGTGFTTGPGRLLPAISYRGPSDITPEQAAGLMDLVATWIRRHRAVA